MTATITPWGYAIDGAIPDIITVAEFNQLTANRFAADPMLSTTISAASAAIRDYCGWHVAPAATCIAGCYGGSRLLHLPFRAVSSITKIEENGVELDPSTYALDPRGLGEIARKGGFFWCGLGWNTITVTAVAGYDLTAVPMLTQAVVQLVSSAMAGPLGVKEEHAGQVGITYANAGGGVTMTSAVCACLAPYRVEEVA